MARWSLVPDRRPEFDAGATTSTTNASTRVHVKITVSDDLGRVDDVDPAGHNDGHERAFRLLVLVGLTWALSVVVVPSPDPLLVAVGGLAAAGLVLLVPLVSVSVNVTSPASLVG